MEKYVDVSRWNGNVDFRKIKQAGFTGVIIKAGYGREADQVDRRFEENYTKAKEAGLKVGCYWYSYAEKIQDGKLEAQRCYEAIKGKQFEIPIYYDIEEQRTLDLDKSNVSAIANDFCSEMESYGYWCGVYANAYTLSNYFTEYIKTRFCIWVADYRASANYENSAFKLHQFTNKQKIEGLSGNFDCSLSYLDYEPLIKAQKLNGWR